MSDLQARLEKLEAESDIRRLKARYLNACDAKDVTAIRDCFTEDAIIDFPPLGEFDVDSLIGVFRQMAVETPITDVHQGHNAEIEINGPSARGKWNLSYANYNPETQGFRLLSSFYHDEYRKTETGWKMSYTRSEPRAVVDGTLDKQGLTAEWIKDIA